jgi:hypothetical protein
VSGEDAVELTRLRADLVLAQEQRRRAGRAFERAKRRKLPRDQLAERATAARRRVKDLQRRIAAIQDLNATLRGRR